MSARPQSKHKWRFVLALAVAAGGLAAWCLYTQIPDRRWWATTLQLIGASVAFVGFSAAYVRARYGRSLWRQIAVWGKQFGDYLAMLWRRLLRRPRHITIEALPTHITAQMGTPTVTVTDRYLFDPNLALDEQVRRMAAFLNHLADKFPALTVEIAQIHARIDEVATHSEKAAEDAIRHIQDQIAALSAKLDSQQVLDLRWAIVGLLITVFGIALSY